MDQTEAVGHKGACSSQPETQVYTKRWLMLFLFSAVSVLQSFSSTVLSSSEVLLGKYYRVEVTWLEWTNTVYSFTGIIFTIPSAWVMRKYGLRPTLILSATISTLGNIFLLFSEGRRGFLMAFVGQTIASVGAAFLNSFSPRLANVWFDPSQVSTANCIGTLASGIGNGLGFLVPSFVLVADDGLIETKRGLAGLNWSMMVLSTTALLAALLWYEERPPIAPSKAILAQLKVDQMNENRSFFEDSRQLLRNRGYVLLVGSSSLVLSAGSAFFTLLDQIILAYFPEGQKSVGVLGMVSPVLGVPALFIAGRILDRTKKFQEAAVLVSMLNALFSFAFILCLHFHSIVGVCLSGIAYGAFFGSAVGVEMELMVELSHPIAEGTSNGWLVSVASIASVLLTSMCGRYLNSIGTIGCLAIFTCILSLGTILAWCTPKTYHRQEANSEHRNSSLRDTNKDHQIYA